MKLNISPAVVLVVLVVGLMVLSNSTPERTPDTDRRPLGSNTSYDKSDSFSFNFNNGSGSEGFSSFESLFRGGGLVTERKNQELESLFNTYKDRGLLSPHRNHVTLRSAQSKSSNPDNEYIEIRIERDAPVSVPISGWRIKSEESGRMRTIGNAVFVPYLGQRNSAQEIVASPGDVLYLISGVSPLGFSFLENICSGYLSNNTRFTPSLSRSCPQPEDQLEDWMLFGENKFSDECLRIIDRIGTCSIYEREVPVTVGPECATFIKRDINYNACVLDYASTENFLQKKWRVYFGSKDELWRNNDEILLLLDESGRLVDIEVY